MIGKTKRKQLADTKDKKVEALDAISIDIAGPVTPADHDGNVYLQMLVDAESEHAQGLLLKNKTDAAKAILKEIRRLELAE